MRSDAGAHSPLPRLTMDCPHGDQSTGDPTAAAAGDEQPPDDFSATFECWLAEQERDLTSLRSAAATCNGGAHDEALLRPLIQRVLGHYEHYYRAKAASARRNVLPMFTPTWTSSTENLFLWAGGWRPTLAVHLLYSKSSLQLKSQLSNLLKFQPVADLAGLTLHQIKRVDSLHRRTVHLEKEISEQEARVQETLADAKMIELSHALAAGDEGRGEAGREMERAMEWKREKMNEVLRRADELRLETLKALVEILSSVQAAHFLIAAAELLLIVHEFGKSKDAAAATRQID